MSYIRSRYSRGAHNESFQDVILAEGIEGFDWITVCKCSDRDELDLCERFFIEVWDAMNPNCGYNRTSGGHSPVVSIETRKKQSEIRRKICANPAYRKLMSDIARVVQNSEQTRLRRQQTNLLTEVKLRRSIACRAASSKQSVKKRRQESALRVAKDPVIQFKRSLALKAAFDNEAHRKLQSQNARGRVRIWNVESNIEKRVKYDELVFFLHKVLFWVVENDQVLLDEPRGEMQR